MSNVLPMLDRSYVLRFLARQQEKIASARETEGKDTAEIRSAVKALRNQITVKSWASEDVLMDERAQNMLRHRRGSPWMTGL